MRITILTIGARGDVQPYVALGLGLQGAGHVVRLATHASFEALVRGRGLDFLPVAGSPQDIAASEQGQALINSRNHFAFWREFLQTFAPLKNQVMADCWSACQDADVIVGSSLGTLIAYHIAEKTMVPLVRAFYLPVTPTRAYATYYIPGALRLGGTFNLWTHYLDRQLLWQLFRPMTNELRRSVLNLPPLPFKEPFSEQDRLGRLTLYGYSPAVIPRPPDWGDSIHVTGYWYLDHPEEWQPPADLADFLQSGPPPVCIGFSSMNSAHPEQTTELVLQALAQTKQRGVLLTGWGGLSKADLPDDVFAIESVPHDWLFPRMAAIVHHGGSGSSAFGLRAGVPSIVVPFGADHPFWARRVHELGVGPQPIPRRHLAADRLAHAIRTATSDRDMQRRASALGARIRAEDGVGHAVEAFHRHLDKGKR